MSLESQLSAILFWKAEPLSIANLALWLGQSEAAIAEAFDGLALNLSAVGLTLIRKDDRVLLGTAPEHSELIEQLAKEELSRDLGKAALETLTIVLYKGPLARAEIDYIRGVNSSFILRNLQIRGLVERIPNPDDSRSFLYRPTFELLTHLGITKIEDLPEYGTLIAEITDFVNVKNKTDNDIQS